MRLAIAAALCLLSTHVFAQETCAPFEIAERFHAEKLNETRVQQGVTQEHIFMVFASPNGETWSLVAVDHEGVACLLLRGTDWQVRNDTAPVPESAL